MIRYRRKNSTDKQDSHCGGVRSRFWKHHSLLLAILFVLSVSLVKENQSLGLFSESTEKSSIPYSVASDNHTAPRNGICDILFSNGLSSSAPSVSTVWHSFQKSILNASYIPQHAATNETFRSWVNDLFEYHHESKLRKTRINAADSNAVYRILEIMEKRFLWLQGRDGVKPEEVHDEVEPEPLHILVLGGSVTYGHDCYHNHLGLDLKQDCPWPPRLEYMFNNGIFGGQEVVKITNMAMGGSSSEIAALVTDYQLFPNHEIPHVVMAAFAPNDAQQPDIENVFYEEIQGFLQSARNVRPCDKDLPLVVLADHMYAFHDMQIQHRLSGYYAALAEWYDVMAFNNANIARHHVIANHKSDRAIQELMGSDYSLHMGVGFHIGMAWTALFNFMESFVDDCNDRRMFSTSVEKLNQSDFRNGRIEHLLQGPPTRYMPRLSVKETPSDALDRWKQREEEGESRCSAIRADSMSGNETGAASASANLVVCSYAFMVGKGTGVMQRNELSAVLDPVLKSNEGWAVWGKPIQNPRVGFYAQTTNATFAMHFPITTIPIHFLTIVSMKSYGPDWIGSKLEIKLTIQHPGKEPDVSIHDIDGFHDIRTSVHFPHKFQLPGNGAFVGDTVILEAKLVGGSTFKINGVALCRF